VHAHAEISIDQVACFAIKTQAARLDRGEKHGVGVPADGDKVGIKRN